MPLQLVVTCEHGGYDVPAEYRRLFRGARDVLKSHRGWDPGALELARRIAADFEAPLSFSTVTRLLVELNRSPSHRAWFSEYTRPLDRAARQRIVADHYEPHRRQVEQTVADIHRQGNAALHLSVHTFTPALNGIVRQAEIGLLYDPSRTDELDFCRRWQKQIEHALPELRVRRNYPYRGAADGFTTSLRSRFDATDYVGIELEVNQKLVLANRSGWRSLQTRMVDTLVRTWADFDVEWAAR